MSDNINSLPRWDLRDFYEHHNAAQVAEDLVKIESMVISFNNNYAGKVSQLSAATLATAIIEYEAIDEIIGKIASYSYLLYSTNLHNAEVLTFFQNNSERINELSGKLIFFSLELNNIDELSLVKFLENQDVRRYQPWLEKIRALKPYQLSGKEERIMHEKSITANEYWVKLFDTTMASMRFNYDGQDLTYAEVSQKTMHADESIRKEASLAIAATLQKNIELLSLITNALAKDKAIEDSIRNAPNVTTFRNLSNQVEDEVVIALVNTVKNNYGQLARRYYQLKAKWLGKERLEFWDRNAPLPDVESDYIQWSQAKEIVLSAYKSFSPEFAALGEKFFDNNWIDAAVYDGKDYGAYSHPTIPSVHPYILMNYQGKASDVMTLAHELGHGVHQLLAAEVGPLMASTPLTLAETASIFGEQLVFKYVISREKEAKKRKSMLAKKVEDSLNTIVRQIMFFDFEFKVHTARKTGELTSQQICSIWGDINKECFGDSINFREENTYFWSAIPHFIHSPFYVYAYAFGNCLVNSLYSVYTKGEVQDFIPKYFDMLRAGGSKKHKEMLIPFSLDASQPSFWQNGLDMVSEMIDELSSMD